MILIIEDDNDVRELFNSLFRHYNIKLVVVPNSNGLIELVIEMKPEIIMIDVLLGIEDGRDICTEIKTKFPEIPVILLSASPILLLNHAKCGADDIIEKPFDIDHFKKKIDYWIYKAKQS